MQFNSCSSHARIANSTIKTPWYSYARVDIFMKLINFIQLSVIRSKTWLSLCFLAKTVNMVLKYRYKALSSSPFGLLYRRKIFLKICFQAFCVALRGDFWHSLFFARLHAGLSYMCVIWIVGPCLLQLERTASKSAGQESTSTSKWFECLT